MANIIKLPDLYDMVDKAVYFESRYDTYVGWALIYEMRKGVPLETMGSNRIGIITPSGRKHHFLTLWYRNSWRCWDAEPTDEERKEEWDDP